MKRYLLILAVIALGQTAWAQNPINVNSESDLRSYLTNSQYGDYTFKLTDDITLTQGQIDINYSPTIDLNNHIIYGNSASRIFYVVS